MAYKKNTAVTGFGIGHFINASTGEAVTTGTPTCRRTLDGVGGPCANAAVYNADGAVWQIDLDASDMNGDNVILSFTLTDCLPISYTIKTVAYDPEDAVRLGLAALPNAAADAAGGLPISDAGGLDLDAKLAALDILTGQDGATLATIQPNYAPSVAGSEMALTADAISAIWAKAMSDLAPGAPSATASVLTAINYLYEWFRNKQTMTADTLTIYKDNGVTPMTAATVSDDGSTTTRGKMGSPA